MAKIYLNENQLHNIIKECVQKVITEAMENEITIDRLTKERKPEQRNKDAMNGVKRVRHAETGYVILSAERDNLPEEENNQRTQSLLDDLKGSPYSYRAVTGGYKYQKGQTSIEQSFIIFAYDRKGNPVKCDDIVAFGYQMAKKYDQDTFMVKRPNEAPIYVNQKGKKDNRRQSKTIHKKNDRYKAWTSFKDKDTVKDRMKRRGTTGGESFHADINW